MELWQLIDRTVESPATPQRQTCGLEGLNITKVNQKGNCLYLHCASDFPSQVIAAIARRSPSSILPEGVACLKLHGRSWALGIDLPIDRAALAAAEIIQHLTQDRRIVKTAFKVLLKQNRLNILCEAATEVSQSEVALSILSALRQTKLADYLQSVTVLGRIKGQKSANWTFAIDPLAIGLARAQRNIALESATHPPATTDAAKQSDRKKNSQPAIPQRLLVAAGSILRGSLQFRWLLSREEQQGTRAAVTTCLITASMGLAAILVLDRNLSQLAQQVSRSNALKQASSLLANNRLDDRPTPNYNNEHLNQKLALLKWHVSAHHRAPEVMILGSSRALRGIEPTILKESLARKGYKGIDVFNLGINGSTAKVVQLQLTEILSSQQFPRMIIWADGVRAFNNNRNDLTYQRIANSPGYTQLSLKKATKDTAQVRSGENVKGGQPFAAMLNSLPLALAQREAVRASLIAQYDRITKGLSNSEALIAANLPSKAMDMDMQGFVAMDIKFDPLTYFQSHPSVPGDYDLDYRNFEMKGEQMDAFNAVANFCRDRGIYLVFVNMPLHNTYLDPTRSRYEGEFNARMDKLSHKWGFTYINMSQLWPDRAAYFSDPSHLNQQGAIATAKKLADSANVPWSRINEQ